MKRDNKLKFDVAIMHKKIAYPFFERIFYRPIASFLTPKIARLTSSPNLISLIGFLIGLFGICLVAFGIYGQRVIGGGVLLVSYVFDNIDGQLARGFQKQSRFGALLDTSLDSIKESLIFFALALAYYSQTANHDIFWYFIAVLFLQRMLGRTIPLYQLAAHNSDVEEIKQNVLNNLPRSLRSIALFLSESYRSGTIWFVVLLGITTNFIKPTFIYFIATLSILFIFFLVKAYTDHKQGNL